MQRSSSDMKIAQVVVVEGGPRGFGCNGGGGGGSRAAAAVGGGGGGGGGGSNGLHAVAAGLCAAACCCRGMLCARAPVPCSAVRGAACTAAGGTPRVGYPGRVDSPASVDRPWMQLIGDRAVRSLAMSYIELRERRIAGNQGALCGPNREPSCQNVKLIGCSQCVRPWSSFLSLRTVVRA